MKHKLTQIAENGISLQRQTWTAEKRVLVMTWQRLFFVKKKKTEQKGKNQKKNSVLKAGRYFFSSCRYKTNWPPSLIKVQRVQGRDGRRHNNHHGPFFFLLRFFFIIFSLSFDRVRVKESQTNDTGYSNESFISAVRHIWHVRTWRKAPKWPSIHETMKVGTTQRSPHDRLNFRWR